MGRQQQRHAKLLACKELIPLSTKTYGTVFHLGKKYQKLLEYMYAFVLMESRQGQCRMFICIYIYLKKIVDCKVYVLKSFLNPGD